jgi:hypothetical protein
MRRNTQTSISTKTKSRGRGWRLPLALAAAFALVPAAQASAAVVTVTMDGAGTGSVTSAPAGIDCSNAPGTSHTACSFDFAPLTQVVLTAVSDGGFIFSGWSGTAGGTCSGSTNPCTTVPIFFTPLTATASFVPPPDPPRATTGAASDVGAHSADVAGQVNPKAFAVSSCKFEYGKTTDYGQTVPCSPADLGAGSDDVPVTGTLRVLDAQTTYHYRLVAQNAGGANMGEDRTFSTDASDDSCSNASIRAKQGGAAALLPDCRAFEMVSPPRKAGSVVNPASLIMSADGGRVAFQTLWIPEAGSEAGTSAYNPYVAQRGGHEWSTTPVLPPPVYSLAGSGSSGPGNEDFAANLSGAFWYAATLQQQDSVTGAFYLAGLDGSFTSRSALFTPLSPVPGGLPLYSGASDDLSHILFTWGIAGSGARLLPGDAVTGHGASPLWEVVGANTATPTIRTVNQDVPGSPAGGDTCGAEAGSTPNGGGGTAKGAISADGSVIYFSAYPGCDQSVGYRVFARINGTSTVAVSASQCHPTRQPACADATGSDLFEGASKDGTRVFFSTPRQLVDGDTDSSLDLYEYDSSPPAGQPNLVQVSAGDPTAADLQGVMAISTDGSRAYFVAHGVLNATANAAGASASPGANNLYVYERDAAHPTGRIAFIATMAPSELDPDFRNPWSVNLDSFLQTSGYGAQTAPAQGERPDGHVLLFPSYGQLVSQDSDASQDLYRYDDDTGALVGVSTTGNGPVDVVRPRESYASSPVAAERGRNMSEDGKTIVFATTEQLSPDDTNSVSDAYEWRNGAVSLLSIGTGSSGAEARSTVLSASGDDVTFITDAPLLSQDTDSSWDAYDVRVDGGYPPPAPPRTPCQQDGCQGPQSPPPSPPAAGTDAPALPPASDAPAPAFAIKAVTAKQRSALAKTGKVTLTVAASEAGVLSAKGTASLNKKTKTVAGATKSLKGAGLVGLKLTLSKAARAQLAKAGKLTVKVAVSYSRVAEAHSVTLKLTHAVAKKKASKKKASKKKSSAKKASSKGTTARTALSSLPAASITTTTGR